MWAKFITNLLLFVAFDLAVSAGIALFWSYEVALAFLLAIYIFRIALSIYDSIRLVLVFYFLGGKARSIKYFSILLTAANCPKLSRFMPVRSTIWITYKETKKLP